MECIHLMVGLALNGDGIFLIQNILLCLNVLVVSWCFLHEIEEATILKEELEHDLRRLRITRQLVFSLQNVDGRVVWVESGLDIRNILQTLVERLIGLSLGALNVRRKVCFVVIFDWQIEVLG